MGTIYLLHFDAPINPSWPCRHYLGWTAGALSKRLEDHASGRGARLTQVAVERGIGWKVAKTWKGSRQDERRLKNYRNAPARLCPICRAKT